MKQELLGSEVVFEAIKQTTPAEVVRQVIMFLVIVRLFFC